MQIRNGGKNRELEAARLAEAALDEMMTDADAGYDSAALEPWGPLAKYESGLPELDNVSSSTAVHGVACDSLQTQNSAASVTAVGIFGAAHEAGARSMNAQQWQVMPVC